MSEDPIGFSGGPNLYSYVENDPVNWIDPAGLDPITIKPVPPSATKSWRVGPVDVSVTTDQKGTKVKVTGKIGPINVGGAEATIPWNASSKVVKKTAAKRRSSRARPTAPRGTRPFVPPGMMAMYPPYAATSPLPNPPLYGPYIPGPPTIDPVDNPIFDEPIPWVGDDPGNGFFFFFEERCVEWSEGEGDSGF
jgi:hypothetical protein